MDDRMAVLTMPAIRVEQYDPDAAACRLHRQDVIRQIGAWLRDSPQVIDLRGAMSRELPRSVWMHFSLAGDRNRYSLYFPASVPDRAGLWIGEGRGRSLLEMFALADHPSGEALAGAVMRLLDAPEMDVIHRWRDGE